MQLNAWERWAATLILLIVTCIGAQHEHAFLRKALPADGLVVAHNSGSSLVIRFLDEQGRVFEHRQRGSISEHGIGRRVTVLYVPQPPSEPLTNPTAPSPQLRVSPNDPLARLIGWGAKVHQVKNEHVTIKPWMFTQFSVVMSIFLFSLLWGNEDGLMGQLGRACYALSILTGLVFTAD